MRFLHLEDSLNDAMLVEDRVLAEWPGALVTRVDQRADFIAALQRNDFDVILSDYSLPGFDAHTALELARAQCPEKPFIFLSGTIGEERAIEALQRGAADYVLKDRPARLVPAIRMALSRAEEKARRHKMEQALQESQQRFSQLAEHSSEIFWFYSLHPMRLLYMSPAAERISGIPIAHFYQNTRNWLAAIHPEDRAHAEAAFDDWVEGKSSRFEEEYRVVRPDGSISWLLDSGTLIRDRDGKVYRASGIAKDITARRLAEDQLREQAALLDKARDAIIATDLDHRISYWNASAERIYGWSAGETFGQNLRELELGYNPARFSSGLAQVLATGEWRGDFNLRSKRGKLLLIESTWSLVRDAHGQPTSILMIDTDATERKELESQLLRADRLDSIGLLAGGVAHDLNNVLSPILMGAELLRMGAPGPTEIRVIENMERSARHGSALVRQLLAFARGEDGERGDVPIATLIEEVQMLLRQSLPRTIGLSIDHAGAAHSIYGDGTQIKQLLLNLSLNARDAMPQGGSLEIRATDAAVDEDLARQNPGAKPGLHVRISVKDTGTGIPPALLQKIFDPFFTTKAIGKGTGLGLSAVLGIAKGHGGFIQVESEVGKGTAFHLFLPAMLEAPADPVLSANPFAAGGHGELVLIVDDESTMRHALQLALERSGYRVVTAPDGPAALVEFERQPDAFALVLADLVMPGMLGTALITAIRSRRSQQRIIAISGSIDPVYAEAVQGLRPPVELLAKPISTESLLLALRRALAQKAETASASDPPGQAASIAT